MEVWRTHAAYDGIPTHSSYRPTRCELEKGDEQGTEAQGQATQEVAGNHGWILRIGRRWVGRG